VRFAYLNTEDSKMQKYFALAVFICFIAVFPFTDLLTLMHDHDYVSTLDNCSACTIAADNSLKHIYSGAIFMFSYMFFLAVIVYSVLTLFRLTTLINLKIRMNN
jgi:predicted transcriptional regulator